MSGFAYLNNVVTLDYDPEKCTGCGTCLDVCPHQVFARNNGKVIIQNRDSCMECGACQKNCRFGAISVHSGVGCAIAVINHALGRKSSSCCCVIEENDGDQCLKASPPGGPRKSPCC